MMNVEQPEARQLPDGRCLLLYHPSGEPTLTIVSLEWQVGWYTYGSDEQARQAMQAFDPVNMDEPDGWKEASGGRVRVNEQVYVRSLKIE